MQTISEERLPAQGKPGIATIIEQADYAIHHRRNGTQMVGCNVATWPR